MLNCKSFRSIDGVKVVATLNEAEMKSWVDVMRSADDAQII
jgi:hypothetical protein